MLVKTILDSAFDAAIQLYLGANRAQVNLQDEDRVLQVAKQKEAEALLANLKSTALVKIGTYLPELRRVIQDSNQASQKLVSEFNQSKEPQVLRTNGLYDDLIRTLRETIKFSHEQLEKPIYSALKEETFDNIKANYYLQFSAGILQYTIQSTLKHKWNESSIISRVSFDIGIYTQKVDRMEAHIQHIAELHTVLGARDALFRKTLKAIIFQAMDDEHQIECRQTDDRSSLSVIFHSAKRLVTQESHLADYLKKFHEQLCDSLVAAEETPAAESRSLLAS